jgi:two-component system response regulator NreC
MTSVILADDHVIVRQGLRALLDGHESISVVADVSNGRDAVSAVVTHQPDVAVIDVAMPGMNGIEATRQIMECSGRTKVVGLSMHEDQRFAVQMLQAGARGYLLKEGAFNELVDAINAVMQGRIYLGGRVAGTVLDALVHSKNNADTLELTHRESETLQLIAEGHTSRAIAKRLKISLKTVETYRMRIMEKLQVHSVAEMTKIAVREGLTSI